MISKTRAVLRIALGSDSLRQYYEKPEETILVDNIIIQKLAFLGLNFTSLWFNVNKQINFRIK